MVLVFLCVTIIFAVTSGFVLSPALADRQAADKMFVLGIAGLGFAVLVMLSWEALP